jgi:hypothetical protein
MLQDPDRMTGFAPDVNLSALPRAPFSLHRVMLSKLTCNRDLQD